MHKDLTLAFENMINQLRKDVRCKGGWHYGSISRGGEDQYSDYDPVFLVSDKDFEQFSLDVPSFLRNAADELLIFWGESFNDDYFKNYCSIIRIGDNLHQLDFFIINQDHPEQWMCRQHCKDCTKENIIFDQTGEVEEFLGRNYRTVHDVPDTIRAMDTYWFHLEMLIKYFKRKDLFKLIKNMDVLFHAHVDLLLSQYDAIDWGAWESKVKHSVPLEKQEHLKEYFTRADLVGIEYAVKTCMYLFEKDAEEICRHKELDYSKDISKKVIDYFNKSMKVER